MRFGVVVTILIMTKNGHHLVGLGVAVAVAAVALKYGQQYMHPALHVMGTLSIPAAFVMAVFVVYGANAPDRLEWGIKERFIPHRTLTHWPPLWLGVAAFGLYALDTWLGVVALGYAIGGVTHLIVDFPNPTGLPTWTPFGKRYGLGWWRSGEMEWLLVPAAWGIAGYAIYATSMTLV